MNKRKPRQGLKLFVWEQVLSDHTDGFVAVLARDESSAWRLLRDKDSTAWWSLCGLSGIPRDREDMLKPEQLDAFKRPRVVGRAEAFVIWGGG